MLRILWVGIAGALGAIARYAIGINIDQSRFPWATLGINLFGSFLLGVFLTMALGRLSVSIMTPVAVGLIGGFTTFSTFAWDGFTIGRSGRYWVAAVYVIVSVLGGMSAAWFGYALGRGLRS
jgi:fluoride exporter